MSVPTVSLRFRHSSCAQVLRAACLTLALVAIATAPPAAAQTQPQTQVAPPAQDPAVKVFGDWSQRCTPNPPPPASPPQAGQQEVCFVSQQVLDQTNQRLVLKITVGFFEPGRQPGAIIALPLGVPLAAGLRIAVDGKEFTTIPFQVCRRDGCQAFLRLSEELLTAFKAGSQAAVQLPTGQDEPLNLPFSLSGFTAGYGSIQ